jgi:hypothetical protein
MVAGFGRNLKRTLAKEELLGLSEHGTISTSKKDRSDLNVIVAWPTRDLELLLKDCLK